MQKEAHLFPVKDAWWYIPRPILSFDEKGSQGASHYVAPNPDFGAIITYHLAEDYTSLKEDRKKVEKTKKRKTSTFPVGKNYKKKSCSKSPHYFVLLKIQTETWFVELNVLRKKVYTALHGIYAIHLQMLFSQSKRQRANLRG